MKKPKKSKGKIKASLISESRKKAGHKRAIVRMSTDLLSDEDFLPQNVECSITVYLTMDVLDEYLRRAKASGISYGELISETLKNAVGPKPRKTKKERL